MLSKFRLRKVVACHTLFPGWPVSHTEAIDTELFRGGQKRFLRLQCHCAGQPSIAWFKATGESFATSEAHVRSNWWVPGRNRSNYLGASKWKVRYWDWKIVWTEVKNLTRAYTRLLIVWPTGAVLHYRQLYILVEEAEVVSRPLICSIPFFLLTCWVIPS